MSGFFRQPTPTNAPPVYSGLNLSTSQYNAPVALFWGTRRLSTNALWFNDFQKHAQKGKGKGGGGKGGQNYTYTAAVILGLGEGPIDAVQNVWGNGSTTTTTSLSALNMTLFSGTATQTPWSFVSTRYASEARAYPQTAYLACPRIDLGATAAVPDHGFECVRTAGFSYTHTTDGWRDPATGVATTAVDCLLSDIIPDLLTNPQYGAFLAAGDIGPIDQFAAYQRAQGLFFSPLLNGQTKVTQLLERWAKVSNSWIFWSGTALQFVPLGDASITGNGVTYTPQHDVAYALGPVDFVAAEGEPPVRVSRMDPADCPNRTSLNFHDRTRGYVDNPAEYKDDDLVDRFGLRDATSVSGDDICDPAVARIAVQLIGKRAAYLRKTYSWKTTHRFIRVLPGTVVTLTEPNAALNAERVRVKHVKEDAADGTLAFEAEEFPGTVGTFVAPLATTDGALPTVPNLYVFPGFVNTPAIVEPDSRFTNGRARILIAASGGQWWGGCTVWLSFDGTSYGRIGTIESAAAQGLLTAGLASHSGGGADTSHTLAVDTAQSLATLPPVTHDDADQLRTLSLIAAQPTADGDGYIMPSNGELLAFGDVAATGTYTANLTYLRRGQYGTAAGAHSTGDQFTVIDVLGVDGSSIAYDLPAAYIGQTLYLKFASFNLFGNAELDLSACAEYRYTPTGAGYGTGSGGRPATPTGLAATDNGSGFALSWNANAATDNVLSYTLYRADGTGAGFGSASAIWTGAALEHVDASILDDAGHTYFLTATNAVGASNATAGVNATATRPAAPTITLIETVYSQYSAAETAGARLLVSVDGPAGTGWVWWVRWRVSGSDPTWNEQRFADLGAAPATALTSFVATNDTIEVQAAYQRPQGRLSTWSSTSFVSTHPTADNTTVTADTTGLRASSR